jgi:lantibiotic modifying enzyme
MVGDGLCWPVPLGPLAGLSHGAAGIAWALLALFARTGEERFRTAARGGIAFERSVFSTEAGNWRDLRDPEHARFPTAWCHGAPGIGLARLATVPRQSRLYRDTRLQLAHGPPLAPAVG